MYSFFTMYWFSQTELLKWTQHTFLNTDNKNVIKTSTLYNHIIHIWQLTIT